MEKAKVHLSDFRCIRFCAPVLLLFIQGLQPLLGTSFLDDTVSYDPPISMLGGTEPGNAGLPIDGYVFTAGQAPAGYAQVTFSMDSILAVSEHGMPTEGIKSIADLKKFTDKSLSHNPNVTNVVSKIGQFNGREALILTQTTSNRILGKWNYSITFFWHHDLIWEKSSILSIYVNAEKRETFDKLVESLKTVRFSRTDPPPALAKDAMQLGLSNIELAERCGLPLARQGSNEIYITEKFVVYGTIDYRGGSKLVSILYSKLHDPQKAASTAEDRDALLALSEPIAKAEGQEILERHTDNGKLTWTSIGDNRWRRSDGAMAALTSHGLTLATAEMWPKLRLKD